MTSATGKETNANSASSLSPSESVAAACDSRETLNAMALAHINRFSLAGLLQLYRTLGSATTVMEHRRNIRDVIPDASPKLIEMLADTDEALRRAEEELLFDEKKGITPLPMNDPRYPQRLRECEDAPLVVYFRGSTDLNRKRIVNMVGTRQCTVYGRDAIRKFVGELRQLCPDVLIVSGLAYGVDICAHREALDNGMETIGVLAHGLDMIYPSHHRETASRMLQQGGLITEFMSGTRPDKLNFVRRNRIVAGLSDACIVAESAEKGGSLITAGISRSYNRDVFAFPGRIGDPYSAGCNHLIRDNIAALVTSAADFAAAMGWETATQNTKNRREGIQQQLFPDLSPTEQTIVNTLSKNNDLQINILAVQSGIPIAQLTATLFEMEMKGMVKTLAGGTYHLIG